MKAAATMLVIAAVLILIGTLSKNWVTDPSGDIRIGPIGAEACMSSVCVEVPTRGVPGDIEAIMILAMLSGFASAAAAGLFGGMALARKTDRIFVQPKLAQIAFGLAAFSMTFFMIRMLSEKAEISWAGFPAIAGVIVAGVGLKRLTPFLTARPALPPAHAMQQQPFGQPGHPPPFGQPGQQSQPMQPFGQPGQQSQPIQPNPFGSPHAQQSQPMQPNPFGSPHAQQSQPMQPNPFGAQSSQPMQPNPFGAPHAQQSQPQPHGQQSQPMAPHGQQPMQPHGQQAAPPSSAKDQLGFAQTMMAAPAQPPPSAPPAQAAHNCPRCGTQLHFVAQYQRWFCPREQQYV